MDRSTAQALQGLLPALSGPLPPQLVDFALSLLAQSRSRASSLKAEEEIARTYACANIACERLKQTLSLPKIEPRPPCPPKIYEKLYRHLDHTLPTGGKKTSQSYRNGDHVSVSKTSLRKDSVPAKQTSPGRLGSKAVGYSRKQIIRAPIAGDLPIWTMPVIRQLCKKLGAPRAPHHIFAGVSSIMKSSNESTEASEVRQGINIPALIIAVYFFTTARLSDMEIKSEQLVEQIALSLNLVKELAEQGFQLGVITEVDIRAHMRQIALQKWVEMDWFQNIKLGSGIGAIEDSLENAEPPSASDDDEEKVVVRRQNRTSRDPKQVDREHLQPGLGTMMQERVDFLSDEHIRDYQEWQIDVMMRIQGMERDSKT